MKTLPTAYFAKMKILLLEAIFLRPSIANATIFWTDAMEPGSWMGDRDHLNSNLIPAGSYTFDAAIKHEGTHSIRLNFHSGCQATAPSGSQCGGAISRPFTATDNSYVRHSFRMGDIVDGAFTSYTPAYTKMVENQSTTSPTASNYARLWWGIGWGGDKKLMLTVERTPDPSRSRNIYGDALLQDNRWYCIEHHVQMNDVGVANGIAESWVDGVIAIRATDVLFRNSGTDAGAKWMEWETIRQGGVGNIWYDDVMAADARIGCGGVPTPTDTQAPTVPAGLRAQAVSSSQINLTWYDAAGNELAKSAAVGDTTSGSASVPPMGTVSTSSTLWLKAPWAPARCTERCRTSRGPRPQLRETSCRRPSRRI